MKNQLRSGVVLSFLNLFIGMIIPIIYTPIMLRMLGQAEYGLYSLAQSTVGYLSLLSFGFGSTIIRYISKYRAENKQIDVEKTYGFFILLFGALSAIALIVGAVLSSYVDIIFDQGLTRTEIQKLKIMVLILSVNCAISFMLSVFSTMAIAYERYVFRRLVDMAGTLAVPIINLLVLYFGFASVGMCLISTVVSLVTLFIYIFYCKFSLKLKPIYTKLPKGLVKELFAFSFFIFIGNIVDMLFWSTDKVILGMLTSSTMVAIYNIGATFNNIVMQLTLSISGVLTPRINQMVVKQATKDELTDLFVRVGRLQFIVLGLVISGFVVFGQVFINLWAGPEYSDSYWITILTMFPLCIPLIQNTGMIILEAQFRHQFRVCIYLVIAVLNVIATYLVVPYLGYFGAALCSCIAFLIGQGLIMNIYYYKVVGIDIPFFWKNILWLSFIPIAMTVIGLFAFHQFPISGLGQLLGFALLFSIIYFLLMYKFSLNVYEKDIIRKPIKEARKRVGLAIAR